MEEVRVEGVRMLERGVGRTCCVGQVGWGRWASKVCYS